MADLKLSCPAPAVAAGVASINVTATGTVTITGVGETEVTTAGSIITVSGTPHSVGGGGGGDGGDTAIVGADGITVISGVPTAGEVTVSGFRTEFVSASGTLQSDIDAIDSSVTLQEAYDNGDGTISTTEGKTFELTGTGMISAVSGTFSQFVTITGSSVITIGELDTTITGSPGATLVGISSLDNLGAFSTVQGNIDIIQSTGHTSGGVITSGTSDNTIDIAAGEGYIRKDDDHESRLLRFNWPAVPGIALTTTAINYIGVEYNSGNPQAVARTVYNWNLHQEFPLGNVVSVSGILHIENAPHEIEDAVGSVLERFYRTEPKIRDELTGGLILSESADDNQNILVSAGAVWDRLNRFVIEAHDTSGSDVFDAFYFDGGAWITDFGRTTWPNTQYNDITSGLTTMTNNRHAVLWFYLDIEGDVDMVYGTDQYVSEAQAEDEPEPSVPDVIAAQGFLIGRLIFKKSQTTAALVETVYETAFAGSLATVHGNLTGLADDDHAQYSLVDGTRAFTGTVGGVTPAASSDLTTKSYVDTADTTISGHLSTEIDTDISTHGAIANAHHDKYTDAEAIIALEPTTSELAASGVATDTTFTSHAADAAAHHTRYTRDDNDAITGSDGITIASGSNTIDVQGFHAEFLSASGTLVKKTGDTMTGELVVPDILLQNSMVLDSVIFPSGVTTIIQVPVSVVVSGTDANINIFSGYSFLGTLKYDSAQLLSTVVTFLSQATLQETEAITAGSHTAFSMSGFSADPTYEIGHDGTTTVDMPVVAGFSAAPRGHRADGNTGNTTINLMAGYVTNLPSVFRAIFGTQQIQPGITVDSYAHFVAHSDVANALINNGGTVTEEVGLDLKSINVGSTAISIRSDSTTATMRHQGNVSIGTTAAPIIKLNGTNQAVRLLVVNDDALARDAAFIKYSDTKENFYILGRARGSEASPTTLITGNSLGIIEFYGHEGTNFEAGASVIAKVDETPSLNSMPTALQFKVRPKGEGAIKPALELRSSKVLATQGRFAYQEAGVIDATLDADKNNFDPEGVATGGTPMGVWRVTASPGPQAITGILAPQVPGSTDFHKLQIINVGQATITLADEDINSAAANRIVTISGMEMSLHQNATANLLYDSSSARWRVISTNLTSSGIQNIVEDITPQLGGNLDPNGNRIQAVGNDSVQIYTEGSPTSSITKGIFITTPSTGAIAIGVGKLTATSGTVFIGGNNDVVIDAGGLISLAAGASTVTVEGTTDNLDFATGGLAAGRFDGNQDFHVTNSGIFGAQVVAPTGTFADSLTISGVPVATGIVGSILSLTTITTDTVLTTSNVRVLADATAGNILVTLPDTSGQSGRDYVIKKIDSTANLVTLSGINSETIDGGLTAALTVQYESVPVVTDGTSWFIL